MKNCEMYDEMMLKKINLLSYILWCFTFVLQFDSFYDTIKLLEFLLFSLEFYVFYTLRALGKYC